MCIVLGKTKYLRSQQHQSRSTKKTSMLNKETRDHSERTKLCKYYAPNTTSGFIKKFGWIEWNINSEPDSSYCVAIYGL